ncbi:FkbM family methyltransferase [Microcoleus sp. MON2_D6]|uniref:FkbM family methyltransferase n=1 Tax=unclassified Microcoleus TaxID=2642155 RepID=UPI002FD0F661
MNNNVSQSPFNRIIPPEIKNDEFYRALQRIVQNEDIKTVLKIGSSSGEGSTEALVTGMRQNPNNPTLFCIEISQPRFAELKKRYANDDFVKCYNVSTVSLEEFPEEEEVINFYNNINTGLRVYPLEQVRDWLRDNIKYVEESGVEPNGIKKIKQENNIDIFDVVIIDGSEFTGRVELDEIYGAKFIMLDDIDTFKNYQNHCRLLSDCNYVLVEQNLFLRHGYSVFKKTEAREKNTQVSDIPLHFFTIVLNGQPFIRYHIQVLKELPFQWHWHIVEGVADLKHDTAWSLSSGGKIADEIHNNGRSNDGTAEYIDELARQYPENITVYRKPEGVFWEGKREMTNAPLTNIREEGLLWQLDVDELWTAEQICTARQMFITHPEKTAAFYWCWYFVGENLVISTRNCYAQNPAQEWLRTWRFRPGAFWASHEPPRLAEPNPDGWRDVAKVNPFLHEETEEAGLNFQHFAYATIEQLRFKEEYYGYANAVAKWTQLQRQTRFPVCLSQYFPWVKDLTAVDTAKACDIQPIAQKEKDSNTWKFVQVPQQQKSAKPQKPFPQIIVDGVFFQRYKTGIARVWKSLLEEWVENGFSEHVVVIDRTGTVPEIPGIQYRPLPAYNYDTVDADRAMLQQVCDEQSADLFISTYYTTPLSTPSAFIAYDMIPEVEGVNLSTPMWREKHFGIRHASAYMAISENTARDLVKFFPDIASDSVTVAHCGVNSKFSPASPEAVNHFKNKYGISKPYFLLIGPGIGYKNGTLFFQAFAQLESRQGFEIVCTGSDLLLDTKFRDYTSGCAVHIVLQLSDEELIAAYSGAVALVYPSKYEGFGLPVLEAIACGCPVITCANASIPEVAGKAALYVNDTDVSGLANALCEVQKPDVRKALIAAGLKQAQNFSWSKMAKTVSLALIDAAFLPLKLRSINLIVFPNWLASEETICEELTQVIRAIAFHPDRMKITLLVDTGNISDEDANLILSSVAMNLLIEEDLDVTECAEISLVGQLEEKQREALLSRIQGRLVLENENKQAIAAAKAENLPCCDIASFSRKRAVQSKTGDWQFILPETLFFRVSQRQNYINETSPAICYLEYLERNCPTIDLDTLSRVASSLENTSWDEPVSATDLNNFAVVALIEAEQCQESSLKEIYINTALEALKSAVDLYNHPLCAAHFALVLALTGESDEAIKEAFHFLVSLGIQQSAGGSLEKIPPALVYLPQTGSSLKTYQAEQLTQILQAEDARSQSILLLIEALGRSQIISYNEFGMRLLHLTAQVLPDSGSINLKIGVYSLLNDQSEGVMYLHRAKQISSDSAPVLQALYIACKDLEQIEYAQQWLNFARELGQQHPHSLEWRWTDLEVNSPFTYVPFETQLLLAVEPRFYGCITSSVLIAEKDWFEKEMEFWRSAIAPGMTVIDVGANVGVYTFSAALRVGSQGHVLAVEPFSGCVSYLQETCRINHLNWVKVCAGAASDRSGTVRLSLSPASELNKIATGEAGAEMQPDCFEEVTCFTLDSLIEQENLSRVDFLKIDVEGHELSVLTGSDRILSEFAPVIMYENIVAGSKDSNLPVADYLRGKGYRLFRYQPYLHNLIPLNSAEELHGNMNIIALPPNQSYLLTQE